MENEIKVNEYIRTKRGIIDKAVKILDDYIFLESKFFITEYGESSTFIKKTDVVKHSPNIIDLICQGDYGNGCLVSYITDIDTGMNILCNFDLNEMRWIPLEEIDIWYEVATKEMMESISYKVTKM